MLRVDDEQLIDLLLMELRQFQILNADAVHCTSNQDGWDVL